MRAAVTLAAVSCAAVLLSACTVGPDYQRPDVTPPARFVAQDVLDALNEGREQADAAARWWTGFDDPVLDRLVRDGLAANFDIRASAARLRAANATLRRARAGDERVITATLDGQVTAQDGLDSDSASGESGRGALTLAGGLPLDVFGGIRRGVQRALAQREAARAALSQQVLATSAEIARTYLRLRGDQRQLELLRESVVLQEKTLSIVRSRFESGLSPELDMQRAITSVENLRANIPPLEQSLQEARNRLATLTGRYAGAYEDLLSAQADIPAYDRAIPARLPLDALMARPDVRGAEADLAARIAAIGVAEAAYYPGFRLNGEVGVSATDGVVAPGAGMLVASLGGLIDQVITNGGARDADLAAAEARADEALADFEQTLRLAVEDVEAVLTALKASRARQRSLEKSVRASRRSFYQAETLYQQGLISFLDVVDAQRVLASADQSLARERTNYATRIAALFEALGVDVAAPDAPAGEAAARAAR
ncbi:efflux transporter outer membrane subunit [Yunchengibacter salinarum]|uniref:efflux transporter outer membrane subunit n=1 Tax=Yunchengibacter salinarum TaxID=3133399 RepID=UPI0035B5BE93